MPNHIIQNLELHYPFLAKEAKEYIKANYDELIVKLKNGETYLYNDTEKAFRRLPQDSKNITEQEFKLEFSYRLRKIMSYKNMTQDELSLRTGIPRVMISNYITGRNIPSFYKIDKIAKALDCSTDVFRYI